MSLDPGRAEEYRRRHDAIWPELVDALRAAGVEDYRIFLDPGTNALFAVLSHRQEHALDALPDLPVMRRWWRHMRDIMACHADGSPVCVDLQPMFTLTCAPAGE
ncbi:L-rhamnose 1-epimerase [Azotobacter vinelandii CA]|uniref:L-rhamnose 1-epimerase n=2 Tax=Azotobacter vinelandii TaxID=354 RepID=C1DMX3_AZOVD|nr:L-rhamnose mutarotase [Azotobacter vinelandii]ACO77153.1 L-rhamnose 1-epimerase [Azotobacter vinelandii DJ]AGK13936.1 L-rhamnose 1-epimerase [Azotobacter vinelandii CA]AGK18660.1 L-rhamnose 1-epimerase [Azotobacter vinelandii CA6]WKN22872.1 L-rhamnose mutarotase [Azotobacter vinelandii]